MLPSIGEIYFANIGAQEPHRVIVVSRYELNGHYIVVVPLTSARFELRSKLPNCVPFRAGEFACTKDCVAQADQITRLLISDIDFDHGAISQLDDIALRDVIKAIGNVICADCEPE
jgi:mRNA-degrading endonuclease toxin of MazEF toxin-antitoxin module